MKLTKFMNLNIALAFSHLKFKIKIKKGGCFFNTPKALNTKFFI